MCDPVTLTALTVASTVVTAGSQIYGGIQANKQGKFDQKVAELNRDAELNKRIDADNRNNIEQQRHWRQVGQRIGQQRAQLAASGVDVNFGSAADIQADTSLLGYEDSSIINQNTTNEIRGYEINAANDRLQGLAARSRGKGQMIGSFIQATGTLLNGASQVGKISKAG